MITKQPPMTISILDRQTSAIVHMRPIIDSVCTLLRVTEAELRGRSRANRFVEARGVVALFTRKHTKLTYAEIGQVIDRDHSTVIHCLNIVDRRLKSDEWIQNVVRVLDNEIEQKLKLIS